MERPNNLKVGDKFRVTTHDDSIFNYGEEIELIEDDGTDGPFFAAVGEEHSYLAGDRGRHCMFFRQLEPIQKGVMRTLTDRLARTLNANLKAFYKLGWIDGDLEVTEEGQGVMTEFLFDHFEKELGEVAQAKVKELEAQEKKR